MFEIGNTLREARLRRDLDIPACEHETKIRSKYLRAMEEEQFEIMPSPTYVRGFLRTYADFLDLDGQLVLDEYESRFGDIDGSPEHEGRRVRGGLASRPGDRSRPYAGPDRRSRPPVRQRTRPQPRRTEAQLLWLAIGGVMAVALLVWLGIGDESTPPAPIPAASGPTESTSGGGEVGGATAEGGTAPPAAATASGRFVIELTGVGEQGSDLVVNGRTQGGPEAYNGLLPTGESVRYPVERSIWMRVGNTEGLLVSVDGEQHELSGGTANFIVSRDGPRRVDG